MSSQTLQSQNVALKRAVSAVTLPSQQVPKEKVPDKGHQSMPPKLPVPQPNPVVGPSKPETEKEVQGLKKAPAPPPQNQKPTRNLGVESDQLASQPTQQPVAPQPVVGPTITNPTTTAALPKRPLPTKTVTNLPAPVKRVLPMPVAATTARKDGKANSQY